MLRYIFIDEPVYNDDRTKTITSTSALAETKNQKTFECLLPPTACKNKLDDIYSIILPKRRGCFPRARDLHDTISLESTPHSQEGVHVKLTQTDTRASKSFATVINANV